MTRTCAVVVFLFLFMLSGFCYGAEAVKDGTDYYALLKRLKNGDTSVNFTALRYAYTKTLEYAPYNRTDKKAMFEALNNREFEKAAQHAQSILEKNYLDLDAHFISRIAYKETGNAEKQKFHSSVVKGLLDSIYDSGNGQTPETAFVVIDTEEEYFFLRIYGYNVMKSSLVKDNGRSYDKMAVEERKTGAKSVFYFNVDRPFTWLSQQMNKKKE